MPFYRPVDGPVQALKKDRLFIWGGIDIEVGGHPQEAVPEGVSLQAPVLLPKLPDQAGQITDRLMVRRGWFWIDFIKDELGFHIYPGWYIVGLCTIGYIKSKSYENLSAM